MNDWWILLLIISVVSLFGSIMRRKLIIMESKHYIRRPKEDLTNKILPKGGSGIKEPKK